MPYQVSQLLRDLGTPVTADPNEPLRDALDRMLHYKFSQLPVVKGTDQQRQFYLITHESILVALHNFGSTIEKTGLRVDDALAKVSVYTATDDLFELLVGMRDMNAALIVDENRKLTHVVTSYDTSQYFRQWAEDIMQVRDVEHSVRRIVNAAFKTPDGEIDETARKLAIEDITSSNKALRKKFSVAIRQYIAEHLTLEAAIVPEWLDIAFLELLKPCGDPGDCNIQTLEPRPEEMDSAIDLAPETHGATQRLVNSSEQLRKRLEAAVSSYLVQRATQTGLPDEGLLDRAFEILYNRKEAIKDFSQLTLAEYIQLFFNDACWGRCKNVIRLEEQELKHMLEGVRDTRNMLAHFREDDITAQRRLQLKVCADWLSERERLILSALNAATGAAELCRTADSAT